VLKPAAMFVKGFNCYKFDTFQLHTSPISVNFKVGSLCASQSSACLAWCVPLQTSASFRALRHTDDTHMLLTTHRSLARVICARSRAPSLPTWRSTCAALTATCRPTEPRACRRTASIPCGMRVCVLVDCSSDAHIS
jgi:hypothetical protein